MSAVEKLISPFTPVVLKLFIPLRWGCGSDLNPVTLSRYFLWTQGAYWLEEILTPGSLGFGSPPNKTCQEIIQREVLHNNPDQIPLPHPLTEKQQLHFGAPHHLRKLISSKCACFFAEVLSSARKAGGIPAFCRRGYMSLNKTLRNLNCLTRERLIWMEESCESEDLNP